jgi:hypothetical protein
MNVAVKEPTVASEVGGWMQTLSGLKFWPRAPRVEDIRIEDIAGALSKMCRYGGHCKKFYSVAEHCVLVARHAPDDLKLTALMHDASEAYLVDVPRPIKPFLPGYYDMEAKLMSVISERFGLIDPLPAEVKRLDNAILRDEREQNMASMDVAPEFWGDAIDGLGVELRFWQPEDAQTMFLHAFKKFGGKE